MRIGSRLTNPGELRTPVELQEPTVVVGAGGAQRKSWTTVETVWTKWTNVHGSEVWASQAIHARMPATVLMRYRDYLTHNHSILKGEQRYEIVSIDDIDERHEYQELKVQLVEGGA